MKIDINKKYRYRNGKPARILCIDAPDEAEPVVSMNDSGFVYRHKPCGGYYETGESDHDFIEVREPREWELILHTDGKGVSIFCDQGGNPKGGEIVRVREITD